MTPRDPNPAAPPALPTSIRLTEAQADAVLLLRAVEEDEAAAALLAPERRAQATESARGSSDFPSFLAQRAEDLATSLVERHPSLGRLRRAAHLDPAAAWVIVPALLIGLATNLLGPHKRINVLANPLAALLLWNLAVYVALVVRSVRAGRREERAPSRGGPRSLAERLAGWWIARHLPAPPTAARPGSEFLELWGRAAGPLVASRLERLFHLGAFTLVLGALLGMYARGLLFEYRATWESTFLQAPAVQTWLGAIFAPASTLSGIALPEVTTIRAPEHGPAAPWIHLYAITTTLVVLVPRFLLVRHAGKHERRRARAIELPTGTAYFRRLWGALHGHSGPARVLPYSYTLPAVRADRLRALLHDVLGPRARIRVEPALAYGEGLEDEEPWPGEEEEPDAPFVLLFSLAQTPESEVHGRLARRLTGERRTRSQGGGVVFVDEAPFRERADPATLERRLAERRRTWDRVLRDAGVSAVHVCLDEEPERGILDDVERAWRPPSRSD